MFIVDARMALLRVAYLTDGYYSHDFNNDIIPSFIVHGRKYLDKNTI